MVPSDRAPWSLRAFLSGSLAPTAAWGLIALGALAAWLGARARTFEDLARRERAVAAAERADRETRLLEMEALASRLAGEVESLREDARRDARTRIAAGAAARAFGTSVARSAVEVRRAFADLAGRHPGVADVHAWLGRFELRAGRLEAAGEALATALELDPDHRMARLLAYEAAVATGDGSRARHLADALAARSDPGDAALGEALAALARPEDPWPRYLLGRLRQGQGRTGEALLAFEAAVRLDPSDEAFHAARARAAWSLADPVGALLGWRAALERCGTHLEALAGAARAERRLDRPTEALEHLDRWIALEPGSAAAHLERAEIRLALGRAEAAETDFLRTLELDAGVARAHFGLGSIHLDAARLELAAGEFGQAVRLDPKMGEAHRRRALALAALGRPADALADLDRAAELLPHEAEVYVLRGRLRHEAGRFPDAIADYERALSLGATGWRLDEALGDALAAAGRTAAARLYWRRAAETSPESDRIREKLRGD